VANPLTFKDFLTVDYTPGMPDEISYASMKRKRGRIGESLEEEDGLTIAGRRALGRAAKRRKARLKLARKRSERKTAQIDTLKKRATKQVRNQLFKKLTKGKARTDVSPARRKSIEKRLSRMQTRIGQMSRKKIPDVRKLDRSRKMQKSG
jgi:hypothetical protein